MPLKVSDGVVTRIVWTKYKLNFKSSYSADQSYSYPEIQFSAPSTDGIIKMYITDNDQSLSFGAYAPGEKVQVSYPTGHPEQARVYSFWEYWLPAPNIAILVMVLLFWTIGYVIVVYKPFKYMGEMR